MNQQHAGFSHVHTFGAPLIDEVVGTARQLAQEKKNRLLVDAPDDLGTLTVDPMRLRQILLNLLSNACKFTKEGEVKLRARRDTQWIELAVSDTGIGMTAEQVRSCSRNSPRPKPRPRSVSAAPGWGLRSPASSRACWAEMSR